MPWVLLETLAPSLFFSFDHCAGVFTPHGSTSRHHVPCPQEVLDMINQYVTGEGHQYVFLASFSGYYPVLQTWYEYVRHQDFSSWRSFT